MQKPIVIMIFSMMIFEIQAKMYNPIFTLNTNFTKTFNDFDIDDGLFEIRNRRINIGFELSNKFPVNDRVFIQSGIRFNQYKNVVSGLNQFKILHDKPDPFTWESRFQSFTIPVLIGKNFKTANGNKGHYFVGMSGGIIFKSYMKSSLNTQLPKNDSSFYDQFYGESIDTNIQMQTQFIPSFEAGINFQPFKNNKKMFFGISCNYQLNNTIVGDFNGLIKDQSRDKTYHYNASLKQHYMNIVFTLSYYFDKSKKEQIN